MKKRDEERQKQIEDDIRKFSDIVYKIAYANTYSQIDAEDVFQDVFVKFCKYYNRLNDDEHKEKWLKRATKHTAINFNKHKKITQCAELNENISVEPISFVEETKAANFIDYLRDIYKGVFQLYYVKNMHIKEISQELNLSECAVKTRLKRGRKELKEILDKVEF